MDAFGPAHREFRGAGMNIKTEVDRDDVLVGTLASAFTLLALAPYDNWSHEGTPAEMAAYVVATARKNGNLSFLWKVFGLDHRNSVRVG